MLGLLVASPASAAPASDLTPSVLKARAGVGLPAVNSGVAIQAAAAATLAGGDAQSAFTSAGGKGDLFTAIVPAGSALSTAPLKSIAFDPRATAIAVVSGNGKVAGAAAVDPTRPFRTPVLAGSTVDPGVAGSLAVLFPPGSGTIPQITLQRYRGTQLVTIGIAATAVQGMDGAILVQLKGQDRITGPQIGYGLTYTLKVGNNSPFQVKTRPLPSVLLARSFNTGPGFTGADRRRFLATIASLPPEGRKIADIIRGAVTVSVLANSAPVCGAPTSCAGFDPGNGYFLILNRAQLRSSLGKFIITHEFGHLVDFFGLDTFSHQAFTKLFSASPKWKACFPLNGQCVPFMELVADQFAFYATNARGVQSGYGDDRLAAGSSFSSLMQAQWAFRPPQSTNPLAGFGPLAKSFEQAMHSGANGL